MRLLTFATKWFGNVFIPMTILSSRTTTCCVNFVTRELGSQVESAKKSKTYKYDLFAVLGHINNKDSEFFDRYDEATQNAVQPFLLQRWLASLNSRQRIIFINELVNPFAFALYKHKKLLIQLLTVCTDGSSKHAKFLAAPKKTSHNESTSVLQRLYGFSRKQADDALKCLTEQQVLDYAEQLGYQKEQLAKIRKEFNAAEAKD